MDNGLKSFIFLMIAWKGQSIYSGFADETPGTFRKVPIYPTNEYPLGRKGYTLATCWQTMKETHTTGMLILDSDVAIDPNDFASMYNAMKANPSSICIGPALIWPKSTGYQHVVWAHRKFGTSYDEWRKFRSSDVDTASFCFTYIPAQVWETCINNGLSEWTFPEVDRQLFETARKMHVPFHVVENCTPKHLNY